jgi:hypothetical protein
MNIHKERLRLLNMAWVLSLLCMNIIGCDDEPQAPENYELSFTLPEEGAVLGCGDDSKRSTPNEIDISVSLSAIAPETELKDLVVELSVTPDRFSPQRRALTEGRRVIFSDIPLPQGEYEFQAKLLNGDVERAISVLNLAVEIDTTSPICGVSENSIQFITPIDGAVLNASDDQDNDLTNGLQIAVEVEVQGSLVSIGEQVEVQVNGTDPVRAQVEEGVARFESVTLPLSGPQSLSALATGPNGLLEAMIEVEVNASECLLELNPMPVEGCDIGSTSDVDPDRAGLQAELIASTDCDQVIWTVNGQSYPAVEALDGQATFVVTLNNGENTVSARAQSANGLAAEVPTYVLDADVTDPELTIDNFEEIGVNRRNREDAIDSFNDQGDAILKWRFNGFTSDLPPNSTVRVEITPALEGAPEEIVIDEEGRFSIELQGNYLCGHQVMVSGDDLCGGVHDSPTYSFCFDGVTPRISIIEPAQLTLINTDNDLETEGLQTQFIVRVEDARDTEDYPIEIHCARGEGGAPEVLSINALLKSQLSAIEGQTGVYQGEILVSFPRADSYTCRPVAMTGQNEPILASSVFRVITDEPIFEILDPTIIPTGNGRSYACFSDTFFIGGQGRQFSEGDTELNFTLYNEAGQVSRFGQLQDQGDGFYSASLELNNQQLANGRYRLEVSGTSGSVEVSVIPSEPIDILIDNEVPIVGPLSPANGILTLANDQNSDLSDCIQSTVEFSLSDESAERVCFSVNGGIPSCTSQIAQGVVRTPQYNFLPGENVINMQVIDCNGASSDFDFTINTEGCQSPLRITNWSDRAGVTLLNDVDLESEGLQISLSLAGSADEVVNVEVASDSTPNSIFGPVTLDALGFGDLIVTVSTSAGIPLDVSLTPASDTRSGQVLTLTTYELIPQLSIRPLEEITDCLNGLIQDQSSTSGFQLRLEVDADGLSSSSIPFVQAYCQLPGNDQRELVDQQNGSVINLGQSALITFPSITLPDGLCDLEVNAVDASGLPMTQQTSLNVDRTPPQIELVLPVPNIPLDLLDDNNSEEPGIQFPTRIRICGAANQTVTVATIPPQANGDFSAVLNDEECDTVDIEALTYINGDQLLTASITDICGNAKEFSQNISGDTGVSIVIDEPTDQALINRSQDLDLDAEGCQIEVDVRSAGFTNVGNVDFAVCASNQNGMISPLCGNQSDVSQGQCTTSGQGNNIRCPISLGDGEHDISIVARENGVDLRSNTVSILTDCTSPSVIEMTIAEDLNVDQCINAQERVNFNSTSQSATFTVDFRIDGIENDQRIRVFSIPGQNLLGVVDLVEGLGSLPNVTLAQGEHFIYLSGSDSVGNPLPNLLDDDFEPLPLIIDTEAPTPSLVRPTINQCLNIADDLEPQDGAQYQPSVNSGSNDGESVSLSLGVDGIVVQRENVSSATYTFSTILLTEGAHDLTLVAEDICGNVGSISGFNVVQNRPDWNAPIPVPISVDLTEPTLILNGINDGQILVANDDANQSPADGFQINITIDTIGLEAGREVKIYSGEERIPTLPARLLTTISNAQTLAATLTLPPGLHALSARSSDDCGNPSSSDISAITIDVDGCSSQITSFISGQIFGPSQGTVTQDGQLRLDISGQVDLLDPQCATAQAELLLNGNDLLGSTTISQNTGAIVFNEISIPEGEHTISTRVRLNNEETYSLGKTIRVDLVAPNQITITSPTLNDEGVREVLQDEDPNNAGQQITIVALVSEAPFTSSRTARISIDGVQLPREINVPDPESGTDQVEVRITDLNPPAREATYQLCVTDEVSNERCQGFTIIADPAAPTGITLTTSTLNDRIPNVEVSFTAPGDDQSGGDRVSAYEARWSLNNINTELTWESAQVLTELNSSVQPGATETLMVEGLPPNQLFYLSLRARDDVGRLGVVRSSLVDTRLNTASVDFVARDGDWDNTQTYNTAGNPIKSIGDFNGDGFDDIMVNFAQPSGIGDVLVIQGMNDLTSLNGNTLSLTRPIEMAGLFFGVEAASAGDVNGDGAPDLIVSGYRGDFSGSLFAIYFGCPLAQNCLESELATADSIINTVGVLRSAVAGSGDVASRLGTGFDDIIIGGGLDVPPNYSDPKAVYVIEGRANWPASIDASTPSLTDGIYALETNFANTGVQLSTGGDFNGDGSSELLFSAGGSIDHLFLVYGGDDFETVVENNMGTFTYDGVNPDFIELLNPCADLGDTSFGTMIRGGVDLNADTVPDFIVGNSSDKLLVMMASDLTRLDCFRRGEDRLGYRFDIAGDIDGDGSADLIVANEDSTLVNAEKILIFYNDGFGLFGEDEVAEGRTPSLSASQPGGAKLATSGTGDMNDDGMDDFALMTYDGNILKVTIYY